uniref:Uncharacterized protein n=1 Tax=Branchiostoma floridae TaxID=7739 RepID=C3Z1A0_BRAFL|eukprot:XP_002597787.1 hypothetical protein BRAFLDRAFT_77309 [Branchiostoma floridae]
MTITALKRLEEKAQLAGHGELPKYSATLRHALKKERDPLLGEMILSSLGSEIDERVESAANPADVPSRSLSKLDAKLEPALWKHMQEVYGGPEGYTIDYMSLDSNVHLDCKGRPLRHYTPWPTPLSAGVNLVAQNPVVNGNTGQRENGPTPANAYVIFTSSDELIDLAHTRMISAAIPA